MMLLNVDRSQPVKVLIHDYQGRLVRMLYNGWMGQGEHEILWDGKNMNGVKVGGKVYFVRVEGGEGRTVKKVMVGR